MDVLEDERAFESCFLWNARFKSPRLGIAGSWKRSKSMRSEHEVAVRAISKTLIFAVNDLSHTSCGSASRHRARRFCRGDSSCRNHGNSHGRRPLQRIREFSQRPNPAIVVSVDMLTTGVDIPDLEFIAFLRPVKIAYLFEQMLGRRYP